MKKRITAIMMALSMCVTMVPTISFASVLPSEPKYVSVMDMAAGEEATGSANKFQTGRLFVTGENLSECYGATEETVSGGVTLLQYPSAEDAERAYHSFKNAGYVVSADEVYGTDFVDANVTYAGDIMGQYGVSVKDSTNTVPITLSPEIMGLSVSSKNITDAQGAASIQNVGVAVIDSGIDTGSNFSNLFSGRVLSGYNVLANSSSTMDDYGHGTFIASIIANNTPSNVKIIPIKAVSSDGSFTASRLAAALQYIVNNPSGINVVNLSLSICTLDNTQMDQITSFINPYIDALYARGIVIVTSAGNKNSQYPNMTADDSYPANYSKVIAVSGIAESNGKWGAYSQGLSGNCVDLSAPARFVRGVESSIMNMTKASASNNWSGEYLSLGDGTCLMSGTSQAAAFVSAAAAHIYSYDTNYDAATVENTLIRNASKAVLGGASATRDNSYGYGYPELSAYVYVTGSYNPSTGGYAGLVPNFDVVVDNASGTVKLIKYTGMESTVSVADSYVINGRTYKTVLGKSTSTSGPFSGNANITTVILGEGVSSEDGDASYLFYGCRNLTSINRIPSNATNISYIFYGCENLLQLPDVPSGVVKMDYAFTNCKKATGTSNITSSGVTSVKGAYDGTTVTILVPSSSTTYTIIKKELTSSGNKSTLNGEKISSSNTNGNNSSNTNTNVSASYKVTFHYRNKDVNKSGSTKTVKVKKGATVKKPKTPSLKGYAFVGWYTSSGKKYNFSSKVNKSVHLYAKWVSTKVGATSITYLKSKAVDSFDIKYKKVAGATGYQTKSSHFANFQSSQIDTTRKVAKRMYLYKNGKTYVKVRAYKKINGKVYFGKWSKVRVVYAK